MAIVQISRITHRKGLIENLPQLAGGELGWALDERRLFIGNGTLAEGAPVVGNTEILTEYSDILSIASTYTYKGDDAGYIAQTGSTPTNDVTRSLQDKLDDFASVKDFGAIGDGEADDTDAINRALYQLFCREVNEEVRRSLYFPAGLYRVSGTIKIPPYAKLWGDGADSSIIRYTSADGSTIDSYVARTADSLQQIGANIGNNDALPPTHIEISSMSFESTEEMDIFLVEKTTQSYFDSVNFKGNLLQSTLSDALENTACIKIASSTTVVTEQVTFDKCHTSNTTYGLFTNYNCHGINVTNSQFNTHYKGIVLGATPVNSGPRGVKIAFSLFDNISAQGIEIGTGQLNVSAYNTFLDVGNNFQGAGNPSSVIVDFNSNNNVSVGDLFERNDADDSVSRRIELNDTQNIAFENAALKMGNLEQTVGYTTTLGDNTGTFTTVFSLDTNFYSGFSVTYNIKRADSVRTGEIHATVGYNGNSPTFTEEYSESASTGITFNISQTSNTVSFQFTASSTGDDATFIYTIHKFAR